VVARGSGKRGSAALPTEWHLAGAWAHGRHEFFHTFFPFPGVSTLTNPLGSAPSVRHPTGGTTMKAILVPACLRLLCWITAAGHDGVEGKRWTTAPRRTPSMQPISFTEEGHMGLGWLADDLATSVRRVRRHPRNFLYPVLILAVGIGSTIGMFTVAYQALHGRLPYRHPDRIAVADNDLSGLLYDMYDYKPNPSLDTVFEKSAEYYYEAANLVSESGPLRIEIARVTPQFFPTLGVEVLGPGFSMGAPPSTAQKLAWLPIVISDRLWRTYFAADPGILNHSVELDLYPNHYQVAGIAPPDVTFPPGVDAWLPTFIQSWSIFQSPDHPGYPGAIGLLHPGLSMAAAEARIRAWPQDSRHWVRDIKTARLVSLPDFLGGELHHLGLILWLATTFFLALTVMAAMSIFQIELEARRQEFTIRTMLGASPGRLYSSFALGIGLVLLSALIASFLVRCALLRVTASCLSFSRGLQASIDGISLAMALGAVGVVFIATVMGQGRLLVPNPRPVLSIAGALRRKPIKRAIRAGGLPRASFPVQITLGAVVLITAALLARSAHKLMRIDPGLQPQNAFICEIALPPHYQPKNEQIDPGLPREERQRKVDAYFTKSSQELSKYFTLILQRLETNPGVVSAGEISVAPYRGQPAFETDSYYSPTPWLPHPGQTPPAGTNIIAHTLARSMSQGAIPALGLRLICGDNFGAQGGDQPAVIVNQALAGHLGRGCSALGQYIQIHVFQIQSFPPARIVGIVSNVHEKDLYSEPQPTVFFPFNERGQANVDVVVRTSGSVPDRSVLQMVEAAVHAIAPDATVSNFASLSERVESAGRLTRYSAYYLLALACLSVFLAGLCAWAGSTSEINRRKQEIGIRMALGGTPGNIVRLVLFKGLKLAALAALGGVLFAWWFSHLLSYLFYGVKLSDPVSYLIGITTIIAFAFIVQIWSINNAVRRNPGELMRASLQP